ncbi:TPA: ead/Ea22-like family protein [Escherichia coli]
MSNINYQTLRMAAENATPGEWCSDDYYGVIADAGLNANYYIASCSGPDNRANKRFIAAANPATVLAVLDEREAQNKRIAELEINLAALAAENAGLKHAMAVTLEHVSVTDAGQAGVAAMIINDALHHSETPATDAFLAEVRAQGVDMARNAMIDFVDGEVGPNKNVPGLIRGAEICVSIAEQLRKGGNQ